MGALVTRCYGDESGAMPDKSLNEVETSYTAPVILSEPRGILRGEHNILSRNERDLTPSVPLNSPIGGVLRSTSSLSLKEVADKLSMGQDSEGTDILTRLQSPYGVRGVNYNSTAEYDDTVSPLGMGDVSVGVHTPHDLTDIVSNADGLPIGSPTSDMTSIKSHMAPIAILRANSFISNPPESEENESEPLTARQGMDLHLKAEAPPPSPNQIKEQTFKESNMLADSTVSACNQSTNQTSHIASLSSISSLSQESGKTTADRTAQLSIKKGKKFTFRRTLSKAASRMFRNSGFERSTSKDDTPALSQGAKSAPV